MKTAAFLCYFSHFEKEIFMVNYVANENFYQETFYESFSGLNILKLKLNIVKQKRNRHAIMENLLQY